MFFFTLSRYARKTYIKTRSLIMTEHSCIQHIVKYPLQQHQYSRYLHKCSIVPFH